MAIDTRDRRAAGVNVTSPWRGILPAADSTVGELSDRQMVTFGYPIVDAGDVFVEAHRYIYLDGGQLTESDMRYLALVDGVADPDPVSGFGLFWINGDGNVHILDEDDNDRVFVTSEGIITSTTTVADTTTETTAYTESIPAGELHVGRIVRVRVLGRYSTANASDTFTARLKLGGTLVDSITSVAANTTDGPLDIEFIVTVRSVGASGTIWAYVSATFDNTSDDRADTATTTIDTTAVSNVTLTIQWDAADVGNTVSIDQGFAELLG